MRERQSHFDGRHIARHFDRRNQNAFSGFFASVRQCRISCKSKIIAINKKN